MRPPDAAARQPAAARRHAAAIAAAAGAARRPAAARQSARSRCSTLALALLAAALALQVAVAVNIIYDETGWTKRDWHLYQIDFSLESSGAPSPVDEAVKQPALRKALAAARLNSLDGPFERKPFVRVPGLFSREDGSVVESPDDDAIDAAAEAVACTTCHSLISHVWQQLVAAVNSAEPINESSVRDMLDDACEAQQVPRKLLAKYRIVKVDAPEAGVSIFVVRERRSSGTFATSTTGLPDATGSGGDAAPPGQGAGAAGGVSASAFLPAPAGSGGGEAGTAAELAAAQKACMDLVNHHAASLQKQLWGRAGEYFVESRALAQKVLTLMKQDADDKDEYEEPDMGEQAEGGGLELYHVPARLLPLDGLCVDLELLCPFWAALGECSANPKYMVGTARKPGHCRASCRTCTPDTKWRKHPLAAKELVVAAAASATLLRNAACTSSKACLSAGGHLPSGPAAVQAMGSVLPGAVLAKTPGFVLGKPFWGVPKMVTAEGGGLSEEDRHPDKVDQADEVLLSEGLGNQLLIIPGMDNFFMYQLEYKRRVYQYHKDKRGMLEEEHVLGRYDRAASEAAASKAAAAAAAADAGRAWQAQWALQRAASKHSGGGGADAAAEAAGDKKQQQPSPLPPPMLDLLDYLPDTESMLSSWWPFMLHMYTKGEACSVGGRTVPRQVELRAACSPDGELHLLVREPEFCQYVMVLFHPQLCELERLKPVPRLAAGGGGAKDGGADAGAGKAAAS